MLESIKSHHRDKWSSFICRQCQPLVAKKTTINSHMQLLITIFTSEKHRGHVGINTASCIKVHSFLELKAKLMNFGSILKEIMNTVMKYFLNYFLV